MFYLYVLVVHELTRKKREIVEITPITAVVELVMIVDFSLFTFFNDPNINPNIDEDTDPMLNLLLYFAHIADMVSSDLINLCNSLARGCIDKSVALSIERLDVRAH